MSRRRRRGGRYGGWTLAAALLAVATAIPASAGMFDYTNDYEGLVERDPGTYLGFDIVKRNGAKKVARVTARLAYTCDNGDGGRVTARARGKLPVEGSRFAGKLSVPPDQIPARARGGETSMTYAIAGELRRRGRARGTIDAEFRFAGVPRGSGATRCYSGKVDWRARRGADVEPIAPGP